MKHGSHVRWMYIICIHIIQLRITIFSWMPCTLQWVTRANLRQKEVYTNLLETGNQDSVVGIATGCKLDARGVRVLALSPSGAKNFLFSMWSRPALGPTQPPIQWVPGVLSPGVKRPWREADHSPPTSAEVKKMWIYTSTPPYAFMAQCLIS
jgi:hypothetical protein